MSALAVHKCTSHIAGTHVLLNKIH